MVMVVVVMLLLHSWVCAALVVLAQAWPRFSQSSSSISTTLVKASHPQTMLRVPSLILSHHATTDYFSGLQHDTGPTIQEKKMIAKPFRLNHSWRQWTAQTTTQLLFCLHPLPLLLPPSPKKKVKLFLRMKKHTINVLLPFTRLSHSRLLSHKLKFCAFFTIITRVAMATRISKTPETVSDRRGVCPAMSNLRLMGSWGSE